MMPKTARSKLAHLTTLFREALTEKVSPGLKLSPSSQNCLLSQKASGPLGKDTINKVADVLLKLDLGITKMATGLDSDIDLFAGSFPRIVTEMNRVSAETGETIYLLNQAGEWRTMQGVRFKSWIQKRGKSGFIEIAVVNSRKRLTSRFSVNLWQERGDLIEAMAPRAPVKRLMRPSSAGAAWRPKLSAQIDPVDVVYTWVNSEDRIWRQLIAPYRKLTSYDYDRFSQNDELRYSLRSLFAFAPWVRKVFIFTNCAPPSWFKPSDRVQWVMHDEVIPERYLPLFNSHSIETFLHEIPTLSEKYIYFNDDVFLSGAVSPSDFFTAHGQSISRMERAGMIPYLLQLSEKGSAEDWQLAVVNGAKLVFTQSGILPLKLHKHVPHAYRKSVYTTMVSHFRKEIEVTRKNKFRHETDIGFSSFLFHHFAALLKENVHVDEDSSVVMGTNFKKFLRNKTYQKERFFCINDGGGSSENVEFQNFKKLFLDAHFTMKSPAEK